MTQPEREQESWTSGEQDHTDPDAFRGQDADSPVDADESQVD